MLISTSSSTSLNLKSGQSGVSPHEARVPQLSQTQSASLPHLFTTASTQENRAGQVSPAKNNISGPSTPLVSHQNSQQRGAGGSAWDNPENCEKKNLYIGLMSGTSMDGIDGVLAQIAPNSTPRILSNASLPMPQALREEFFSLNVPGGLNELERVALAGQQLAACYAQTCTQLLEKAALSTSDVTAIGAHGQTIRHRPDLGYTSQVNAPAVLAETTGINVIADFRSRDVAAGGQGAPLVPAFHATVFRTDYPRAILNLGGMANVTLLASVPSPAIAGFDTGPGNALLDLWCQRHTGQSYDAAGKFAAQGQVNPRLLDYLLASEPWLSAPPPKSTGRDLFNADWLDRRLDAWQARDQASRAAAQSLSPSDIQATLQFFTARTIAMAIERAAPDTQEILVCGGGAHNDGLMRALAQCLNRPVLPTDKVGIPGQWVEALAFAWLAYAHLHGIAAGLPDVTGARAPHVLGAFYPA